MSEVDTQPRDQSTGQFTPAEPAYGEESVWIDQGYIPRPDPAKADAAPSGDDEPWLTSSSEDALRALARKTYGDAPEEVVLDHKLYAADGSPAPDNLAQTIEQAAADDVQVNRWTAEAVEAAELAAIASQVDKARLERVLANPGVATYYGLDLGEVLANAEKVEKAEGTQPDAKADTKVETGKETGKPEAMESEPEGRRSKVAEMIQSDPEARAEVEGWYLQAAETAQQYTTAINTANQVAQASLIDAIPELAQIPTENWEAALQLLHQNGDQRVQRAMGIIGRVAQTSAAQQQLAQQRAYAEQQAIETWAKAEDARLEQMNVKFTPETVNDIVEYAGEVGISRQQLREAMVAHPILRSAPVQKMMVDASKWRALQRAPAKAIPKPVPAVVKPGVAPSRSQTSANSVQALRSKLERSGSVEDAYALYQAQRKQRG
jgi:chemotaxis protein histidine kinase CheA